MQSFIAIATSILLLCPAAYSASLNFDQETVGQAPSGWTFAITGAGQPDWRVEKASGAPSGTGVLKQSALVAKSSFPLALKNDTLVKDGFVEVKFKTVSGETDQAAGVVWRAQSVTNYYICRANALEDNMVLYKVENGKRQALEIVGRQGGYGVDTKVLPAQWHTLRVEFAGSRFKVLFNGKLLFETEDTTFKDAGAVGLWTKADSVTIFDDFSWGN